MTDKFSLGIQLIYTYIIYTYIYLCIKNYNSACTGSMVLGFNLSDGLP